MEETELANGSKPCRWRDVEEGWCRRRRRKACPRERERSWLGRKRAEGGRR